MTRFKIVVDNNEFEVENNYDSKRNVTQFDIYAGNKKQFSIEPSILYGHGDDILWQLSDEYADLTLDANMIVRLGRAIEKLIN